MTGYSPSRGRWREAIAHLAGQTPGAARRCRDGAGAFRAGAQSVCPRHSWPATIRPQCNAGSRAVGTRKW